MFTSGRKIVKRLRARSLPATSLIEMMITVTIFSIVAILATTMMTNTLRSARKIQAQVFLYTETQALMDRLARSVERSAIDYEAYYSRAAAALADSQVENGWHTENYGYYGQTFYYPFNSGSAETGPYSAAVSGYGSSDLDYGTHPFPGISGFSATYSEDEDSMNAMCERVSSSPADCTIFDYHILDELILINGSGDERTVFLRRLADSGSTSSTPDYQLAKMQLVGSDSDLDGVTDLWVCDSAFTCTDTDADGNDVPAEVDFVQMNPSSLHVESFYVYISPIEDPYRAFAESGAQVQPQVTIVLTATLSENYGAKILGDPPSITLQRTVSTEVYNEIVSYE